MTFHDGMATIRVHQPKNDLCLIEALVKALEGARRVKVVLS